jgi:hypothetical protein
MFDNNHGDHFVKKCFVCKVVLGQCRCADKKKLTIWSVCDKHAGGLYRPGDPEWVDEEANDRE